MKAPVLAFSFYFFSAFGLAQIDGIGDLSGFITQFPMVALVVWLTIRHQQQLEKVLTESRNYHQQIEADNRQGFANAADRIESGVKDELSDMRLELKGYREQMAMNNAVIADYAKATELIDHLTSILDKQDARINAMIRMFLDNGNSDRQHSD